MNMLFSPEWRFERGFGDTYLNANNSLEDDCASHISTLLYVRIFVSAYSAHGSEESIWSFANMSRPSRESGCLFSIMMDTDRSNVQADQSSISQTAMECEDAHQAEIGLGITI
jgi:hypothetical protein